MCLFTLNLKIYINLDVSVYKHSEIGRNSKITNGDKNSQIMAFQRALVRQVQKNSQSDQGRLRDKEKKKIERVYQTPQTKKSSSDSKRRICCL